MLDSKQENPNFGTLYIVSTPIGHKRDITYRAADILQICDIVIGEEFKEASRVLMNLNLNKPIELLNEHNEKEQVGDYIELLQSGKTLALISDCGTPIFADPGFMLVKSAIQNNIPVVVVPGASSIMTAIVRSGFPIKKFFYAGFLSANSEQRYEEIKELMYFPYTFVVMDTPYRLKVLLEDFADLLPKRKAYLGMNLTLNSETHHYGTLEELYEKFKTNKTKAEYVLVVEGFAKGSLAEYLADEDENEDEDYNEELELISDSEIMEGFIGDDDELDEGNDSEDNEILELVENDEESDDEDSESEGTETTVEENLEVSTEKKAKSKKNQVETEERRPREDRRDRRDYGDRRDRRGGGSRFGSDDRRDGGDRREGGRFGSDDRRGGGDRRGGDRRDGFKSDRPRRSEDFPQSGRRPYSPVEGGESTAPRRERSSDDRRSSGGFSGDRKRTGGFSGDKRRSGGFGDKRRSGSGAFSGDRKRSDKKGDFKSSRPKRSKDN